MISSASGFLARWTSRARLEDCWPESAAPQRFMTCDQGSLLIHGQCLAEAHEISAGLSSYLRTGSARDLMRWPGSYSVVAVRASTDVTIVTDLAGQFPIFYVATPSAFWFGSDASALARMMKTGVDPPSLTMQFLGLSSPMITGRHTMLSGVCRVAAEEAVRVDDRLRVHVLDVSIRPGEVASLDECAATLQQQLIEAVRRRIHDEPDRSVSADLSGGVDSTALAFLAARHRFKRLAVFTYNSSVAPVWSDLSRATAIAEQADAFEHHIVEGTATESPFQELDAAPHADLPGTGVIVFARTRLRFAAVAAVGSRLHLTGDGGDLLAGPTPACLADFAVAHDYKALWRHSASWARLRNRVTAGLVLRAVRVGACSPRQALHRLASDISADKRRLNSGPWEDAISYWSPPGPAVAWLTPGARNAVVDYLHARADSSLFPIWWRPSDYAVRGDLAAAGLLQRELRATAGLFGVDLHSPYLDSAILRTCLGLTAGLRTSATEHKPLFRRALAGMVPAAVLDRQTKGDYTRDQYIGLRRSESFLRSLFHSSIAAEMGLLEPHAMLAVLDSALLGLDVPWSAFSRVVATEIWLRRFHRLPLPETG